MNNDDIIPFLATWLFQSVNKLLVFAETNNVLDLNTYIEIKTRTIKNSQK